MNVLLAFESLIHDRATVLRSMGSEFRAKQLGLVDLACWLALVGGLLLLVSLAARAFRSSRKRRTRSQPALLFRELCHAHRLSGADRRLLRQLAAHRRLAMAAEIFLRPECFDPPVLNRSLALAQPRLTSLKSHLFPTGDSAALSEPSCEPALGLEDTVSMTRPLSMADTVEMQKLARPLPPQVTCMHDHCTAPDTVHAEALAR